jgi:lysozyme
MKLSAAWFNELKRLEGCKLEAYQDEAGVWTIGFGDTRNVSAGDRMTREEAEARLQVLVTEFEAAVQRALKRPVSQPQFDALTTLCFNIGAGAFTGSTLLRLFNTGDVLQAAREFGKWIHVTKGGKKMLSANLVQRRFVEVVRFLSP